MAKPNNVEDVYELSPFQHGVLFHTLYAPGSGAYVEQLTFTLQGQIDLPAFEAAWQTVFARHPILRTSFHWRELDKPLQVVQRELALQIEQQDWRGLSESEQSYRLRSFLDADRKRGFDLAAPPLTRMTLLRVGDQLYKLLWRFPHLILDGWSFGLSLFEFLALYRAHHHGRPLQLPHAPRYRDYIAWLKNGSSVENASYFRERLAGFERPNQLDIGRRPPPLADGAFTHDRVEGDFSELSPALGAFARRHHLTLNTIVQGAFMVLLSRYTGDTDLVVGSTLAARSSQLPSAEQMVGPMLSTVPIRMQVAAERGAVDWLTELQSVHAQAREHGEISLIELHALAEPGARRGLFEATVAFENVPLPALDLSDVGLQLIDSVYDGRPHYPLTLVIFPGEQLLVRLIYDCRRYRVASARALLTQLRLMIESLLARPDSALRELAWLAEAEREQLIETWNQTSRSYPYEPLHRPFERLAAAQPAETALVFEGETMSYGELNARANQLAAALVRAGIGPERCVSVIMERSPELVIAVLAVLKAGGAYVPIEPSYPAARQRAMLETSGAALVLCDSDQPDLGVPRLRVERRAELERTPQLDPQPSPQPDAAIYVIFTSGSTGAPKGVINTWGGLHNRLAWMQEHLPLSEADRVLHKTPFTFDVSFWELLWPLRTGATLVLARPGGQRDPAYLAELIERERVSVVHFVPSMLQAFLGEPVLGRRCASLRFVVCSGEELTRGLQQRCHAQLGARLVNLYGPTEAAIDVSYWDCERCDDESSVPIGRPIANTQLYVLDPHMQPVPVGAIGELYIGGAGLARGYCAREDLTRERFVDNPLRPERSARLYRTGDRARFREDGAIEFLGRVDQQIKLRGLRIEPAEIEAALRALPGVRDALVGAPELSHGERQLVAYVVAGAHDAGELRAQLALTLPPHLVPAFYVFLAALPVSDNGKVDRRALPRPNHIHSSVRTAYAPPRTPTERRLTELTQTLLKQERIGVDDALPELGLHSLLATQLVKRIKDELRVELPLRALFEQASVAELAQLVDGAANASGSRGESDACSSQRLDLSREAALHPSIAPGGVLPPRGAGARVLLTGASGFLGTYLLHELLSTTNAEIVCLVRAPNAQRAQQRISARLRDWGLWREPFAARIHALPGDLARPRFGLSDQEFDELGDSLDAIYHSGAQVHFLASYAELKATNVSGTAEALRLACRRGTPFHHISTVGVFGLRSREAPAVRESDPGDPLEALASGYARSKRVAEELVRQAERRGLPVSIYRPGRITGHSRTGQWESGDLLCQTIKACSQLRLVPALDLELDMVPVDYASAAIVALAAQPEAIGRTFHITNPRRVSFSELHGAIEHHHGLGRRVPFREWRDAAMSDEHDPQRELLPLVSLLSRIAQSALEGKAEARYDCSETLALLRPSGLGCPSADSQLLGTYLQYLSTIGFIQLRPPSAAGHSRLSEPAALSGAEQ